MGTTAKITKSQKPPVGGRLGELLLSCEQERSRAEARIHLLQLLTMDISESPDFYSALNSSLRTICRLTGWCYGEAWIPAPDGKVIECSPAWYKCSRKLDVFRRFSMDIKFASGVGLPGRVWKSGKPEWIKDVSVVPEQLFLRTGIAGKCSLKAGFGVPIARKDNVLAVLAFFLHKPKEKDSDMVELVSAVATQLGALIQRKKMEEELALSRIKLRNLSLSLQRGMETERKTLARRIHDELGQSLSALKMDLSWIKKQLNKDQKNLFQEIDRTLGLIQTTIRSVQNISAELRPALLDNMGLTAAINWHVKNFEERKGIKCRIVSDPEEVALDPDSSTALFRIFQEALTNTVRHSGATKVLVNVKKVRGRVTIEVIDNGRGIGPARLTDPGSIGIIGMRERAESFGGILSISSEPGKGTTVKVSVPVATSVTGKK